MAAPEAVADVLADFVPRYAGGPCDSAADLEEAASCSDDAGVAGAGDCRTLRELRAAARRAGRKGGRLGIADYVVQRAVQRGGFGRVALVRVEGVAADIALKTVRGTLARRGQGA